MNRFRQFSGAWAIGLMLGLPATPASAADIYVATNGVAPNDGSTWSLAYTNIQDALNIAANGETIYLAGQTFLLTNQLVWAAKTNVSVRGGYAATNDANAPGTPDSQRWPTILTRAAAYTNRIMFVTNVSAVTLRNCLVKNNTAPTYANGIYIEGGATVTLRDSIIADNQGACSYGGGICNYGTVALTNCLVVGNSTRGGQGDCIRSAGSGYTFDNCTVAYNTGLGL